MKWWVPLLIVALCLCAITPIQRHYARQLAGPENDDRIFKVPERPQVTMAFSFGYECIWVDLFWFRMVQYFGGNYTSLYKSWKSKGYLNLANTIVTLDPKFHEAYPFIAFTIIDGVKDYRAGMDYYRRGVARFPDDVKMSSDFAWNLALSTNVPRPEDKEEAIRVLENLIRRNPPGLVDFTYVPRLLAILKMGQKDYCGALAVSVGNYRQKRMSQNAADASLYQNQIRRIILSYTQDNLRQYLAQYRIDHGTEPLRINDLVGTVTTVFEAKFDIEGGTEIINLRSCEAVVRPLPNVPDDPRGGKFVYVPVDKSIQSTVDLKKTWSDRISYLETQPVQGFRVLNKRFPASWDELLKHMKPEERKDAEEKTLRDEYGGHYQLDPAANGKVVHVMDAPWWVDQMGADEVRYTGEP